MTTAQIILIIANVISFIGNCCFTLSSVFKKKRVIISLQTVNHGLSTVAQFMTEAYSGMVQDSVCFVRNIILLFVKDTQRVLKLVINIICILVALVAGILINIFLNGNPWYGYLPVIASLLYSECLIFTFVKKDVPDIYAELNIKLALIINSLCWGTYGIMVALYPITIFNSITLIVSVISIARINHVMKKKKMSEKEEASKTSEEQSE